MGMLDNCLEFTFQEEGGFVDDPRDPGGATNMGITLVTLRTWLAKPDVTVQDVRSLTRQVASSIYGCEFWNRLRADALPGGINLMVFDFAVMAGSPCSAKILQRALGLKGDDVDGSIGPDTIAKVGSMVRLDLINRLATSHMAYYRSCAGFPVYGHGWTSRATRREQKARTML